MFKITTFLKEMKLFLKILPTFLFVIFSLISFGQSESDYYYQNAIFKEDIKTVQLYKFGFEMSHPIISLNSEEQLILKFDELTTDIHNYYYTLIHCDTNWKESYLVQSDYLEGFYENPITDYLPSFNTSMDYINYQLLFPNEDIKLKYSGNYALVVYEDRDMEKLVLTRRFQVLERKAGVTGEVKRATFDPYLGDNQEVDFKIDLNNLNVRNPHEEIKVVVMKNQDWDNAITNLKPLFIKGTQLDYDYNEENVFPGGNEYRYFDARSHQYNGEYVDLIDFFRPYYHFTLTPSAPRVNDKYFSYEEMNGNYVIQSSDSYVDDPDTECDYFFVHFTLDMPSQLLGGSVHVFGELTDWGTNATNVMTWNYETNVYELSMLLKQGYYNYEYVFVPEDSSKADETWLEGSHYETENEYQILVYYKSLSGKYYQLIGYQVLNSF